MGDSVFEEFLDFFNSLLIGSSTKDDGTNDVLNIIQSESVMEASSAKLSNTLKKFTQVSEQNIYADKKITIDCGKDKLTDWHLKPMGQQYTWFGDEIPNTACIKYGCCYDVSQTANISLSSIQETTTSDHEEMWNKVTQEMESKVKMTLGENSKPSLMLNSAINEVKSLSLENIKKVLENVSLVDIESKQEIEIIATSPLRCKNRCSEPATAGFVEQSLNVEVAVNNIITDITKSISETFITMSSKTESTITNVDMKKIYIFAALSCLLVVTVFIISYIIVYFVLRYFGGGMPPPEIAVYLVSIFLTIFIFSFWSMIICIIRASGKLSALFCFIR